MRVFAFYLFFLLLAPTLSWSKEPVFPAVPAGFRAALEIELEPQHSAKLMPFFDFDRLQKDVATAAEEAEEAPVEFAAYRARQQASAGTADPTVPPHPDVQSPFQDEFYDDYLHDYPQAWKELLEERAGDTPHLRRWRQEIYKQLTNGLKLEERLAINQHPDCGKILSVPQAPKILGADSGKIILRSENNLPNQEKWQRGNSGLVLPKDRPAILAEKPQLDPSLNVQKFHDSDSGIAKPATLDWEKLFARWKALPLETKRSLARWELLSPTKKAALALLYHDQLKLKLVRPSEHADRFTTYLRDADASRVTKLFSRLEWLRDRGMLEFRHKKEQIPTNLPDYYNDVRNFAQMAGVDSKLLHWESSGIEGVNLHIHMSAPGDHDKERGILENDLLLLLRAHLGIVNDLKATGEYTYHHNIYERGLLRAYRDEEGLVHEGLVHSETRVLPLPLDQLLILKFYIQSLPFAAAKEFVKKEMRRRLDSETIDRFLRLSPELLSRFEWVISREEIGKNISDKMAMGYFRKRRGSLIEPYLSPEQLDRTSTKVFSELHESLRTPGSQSYYIAGNLLHARLKGATPLSREELKSILIGAETRDIMELFLRHEQVTPFDLRELPQVAKQLGKDWHRLLGVEHLLPKSQFIFLVRQTLARAFPKVIAKPDAATSRLSQIVTTQELHAILSQDGYNPYIRFHLQYFYQTHGGLSSKELVALLHAETQSEAANLCHNLVELLPVTTNALTQEESALLLEKINSMYAHFGKDFQVQFGLRKLLQLVDGTNLDAHSAAERAALHHALNPSSSLCGGTLGKVGHL